MHMRICELHAAACIAVELVSDLSYLQRCNIDVYHGLQLGGNIEPTIAICCATDIQVT